jgi:hypothetical protein
MGAPQLARIKAHRVKPLRILASAVCVRVGVDVAAVDHLHRADSPPYIPRQSGVSVGMTCFGTHPSTGCEAWRMRWLAVRWAALAQCTNDIPRSKYPLTGAGVAVRDRPAATSSGVTRPPWDSCVSSPASQIS